MKLARKLPSMLAALSCLIHSGPAAQDSRDKSSPITDRYYQAVSEAEIRLAEEEGYRLTDLELDASPSPVFSAVMVENSGEYATDSWWYFDLTAEQVSERVNEHQARLIDLEPYELAGQARFACVMVSNTGAGQKTWWWYQGLSSSIIQMHASTNIARLVDVDRYSIFGVEYFSAVMIANSSTDARGWWWLLSTDAAEIAENIARNGSRIWDIEGNSDGSFDAILVLDRLPAHEWSWAIDLPPADLPALLAERGHRLIDIESYENGGPRLAVALIANRRELSGSIESLGAGCGGSNPHSQTFDGPPNLGQPVTFHSQGARPGSPVALILGFSSSSWGSLSLPLDLSSLAAPGCMLYSSVQRSYLGQSDSAGMATVQIPIPDDPGLLGRAFYTQFVALDPSANLLGLTTSDGAIASIGNLSKGH